MPTNNYEFNADILKKKCRPAGSCSNIALLLVGHVFTKTEEREGEGGEKEPPSIYFQKQPVDDGDK